MLTPNSLLEKKCYVCFPAETCDLSNRFELVPCPVDIVSVKRVLNSFFVQTTYGVYEMSSYLIHDTEELAKQVCDLYNEKGGVENVPE